MTPNQRSYRLVCLFVTVCLLIVAKSPAAENHHGEIPRPVTVADAIRMTRLGVPSYMDDDVFGSGVAVFSPNGKRFAVILKKGDLGHNSNSYSVLVFKTAHALYSRKPEAVVTMSSSSNREAIIGLKWLGGSDTLSFIGENRGTSPQVYAFHLTTKLIEQLTHHPTPVISYDVSEDGNVLVFETDPPLRNDADTPRTRREGFIITAHRLDEVLCESERQLPVR